MYTSTGPWTEELRQARIRPAMFVGLPERAHLDPAIEHSLWAIWDALTFVAPQRTTLTWSPTQYHLKLTSGPVRPEIEQLGVWGQCDVLIRELSRVGHLVCEMARLRQAAWVSPFEDINPGVMGDALILAERGLIAIRTSRGMWCQVYEQGWPTIAPFLLETDETTGLAVAAALDTRWFTGLPYAATQVEDSVPECARSHTAIHQCPTDTLIPAHLDRASVNRFL